MSARARLALDLLILIAFVAAMNPAWTGMPVHEWIGILIALPALLHLIVNADLVVRTATSLLEKGRASAKVNLAIDVLLFIAVVGVCASGALVTRGVADALGLPVTGAWHAVHLWTADLTILLSIAHFALHVGWIGDALGKQLSASKSVVSGKAAESSATLDTAQAAEGA